MGNRRGPDGRRLCAGTAWVKAVMPFRRACQREELPCWICRGRRGPLLYEGVDRNHPLRFSVDHVVRVELAPELAMDPSNWRPAHRGCNTARGNRDRARTARAACPPTGFASEQW